MKIKADLRFLTADQEISYTIDKYLAGTTAITIDNASNFNANDIVLFGQLGSETAEVKQISFVSGKTLTLTAALTYDHPQDESVVNIGYDKINFFYSSTVTGTLTALNASPQSITPDNTYNTYDDTVNTTGYGWFRFYNSVTAISSSLSNAVPYAGWADNSVKVMLDTFFTQISNRERKLIREEDVMRWMNEAYAIAQNRLNLSNREYTVPTPQTLSIVASTAEYDLPDYFSKTRVVTTSDGTPIDFLSYDEIPSYTSQSTQGGSSTVRYYIRGTKIGFAPTPSTTTTYYHYYQKNSTVLSSYIDYILLPNNNHYFILDFLLYRATPIIGGDAKGRMAAFNDGLNALVVTSHKRDDKPAQFDIDPSTLV